MTTLDQYLDIDWLKARGKSPQWFGLGFIQLKLNASHRMHFWHPKLMADVPEEEVHDHRYDFTSHVLLGEIENQIYQWKPQQGEYHLNSVACEKGSNSIAQGHGDAVCLAKHTVKAGSKYWMQADTLHRIKAEWAVTLLERDAIGKDRANVVQDPTIDPVCPFGKEIDEDTLWQYIHETINGFPVAYHSSIINKGKLGEVSKIIEEAYELQDAHRQDNPIMSLCEASDLVGALGAFMDKHHPTYNWDDLKVMMEANRRAFETGRR